MDYSVLLFWLFIAAVVYTYAGYPFCIWLAAFLMPRPVLRDDSHKPRVSVVMAAYNEERQLPRRICNLLEQEYPDFEILVASDGSTDGTCAAMEKITDPRVRFFPLPARKGKPSALKYLLPLTSGEIIVFADARQEFERTALSRLAADFADPAVGCVSGELILVDEGTSSVGKGLGLYWQYEKFLRRCESAVDSMLGATGAIYAIRKQLFFAPPSDIILDDMYIPLMAVHQGYRAVFEPRAKAYDRISQTAEEESRRKIRTLAGNIQLFIVLWRFFNPFNSRIAIQMMSHKVMRLLVPYFLILILLLNLNIWFTRGGAIYSSLLAAQILFYCSAMCGMTFLRRKMRFAAITYMFCRLNIDALRGAYSFASRRQKVTWKK